MAIQLEFINLIIPIKVIENKYTGGWNQCVLDHKELIGGRVWYDDFLFKDGAMDPMSMKYLVDKWEDLGFQPFDIHKKTTLLNGLICAL